jgi:hypothetical protein
MLVALSWSTLARRNDRASLHPNIAQIRSGIPTVEVCFHESPIDTKPCDLRCFARLAEATRRWTLVQSIEVALRLNMSRVIQRFRA